MRWKRRRSPAQARTGDNEDEEKAITSFRVHFFKGGGIFLLSYCLVMSSVSSSAQSTHKCCVVGLMCVCVFVCGKPTELVCETSCVCGTMRMWWRGRCREDTLWLTPLGAALQCASGESPDWQNLLSFASVGHFLLLPLGFLFHHILFYFEIFLEFLFRSLSVCDTPARILLSSPTLDQLSDGLFCLLKLSMILSLQCSLRFTFAFLTAPYMHSSPCCPIIC